MAVGDYTKTTYVNLSPPAISAANLNNIEDKVSELDTWAETTDSWMDAPTTDTIAEATAGSGVTIDGLLIKDGAIPIYAGLFPEDPRGLTCSNAADADHDITISAGGAADSTRVIWLALAAANTKQIDAAWAAGDNAGGMDDGAAPVANTPYYVFLIRKDSDGSIDALFSLSATAPTMPAGYTYKRRIMSVCTDAAANIRPIKQTGDTVILNSPVNIRAYAALASTARQTIDSLAPPGSIAIISALAVYGSGGDTFFWFDNSSRPDVAPGIDSCDLFVNTAGALGKTIKEITTDASRNIFMKCNTNTSGYGAQLLGWIDDRGRIA